MAPQMLGLDLLRSTRVGGEQVGGIEGTVAPKEDVSGTSTTVVGCTAE